MANGENVMKQGIMIHSLVGAEASRTGNLTLWR
jgi:hypothetical protein